MIASIFLLFFSGFLLLWHLGTTFLTNWDEAWYAGISRNMLLRNDFVVPFWNNSVYLDKGPLYHWLSILSYKLFPQWELAARLPSALAALGCIFITYFLAKRLFNRKTALLAALILSSSIGFLYRSRTGNFDSIATFFILLFFLSILSAGKNQKFLLLLGPSLAGLFLTKGGLIFYPLLVSILYLIRLKKFKWLFDRYFLSGLFLSLLIPGIWLYLGYSKVGPYFLKFYLNLLFLPLVKFAGQGASSPEISFRYVRYLFYGLRLWFFPFVPAFIFAIVKMFKNIKFFFLVIAFLPFFLILLGTKEAGDWYLLPLYPITAIMISAFLIFFQEKFLHGKVVILAISCLILAVFQAYYFRSLFIVPQSVQNEVALSLLAGKLSSPQEILFIDDYYFPVASFYSDREIRIIRREAADVGYVISEASFYKTIDKEKRFFVLTNSGNFEGMKKKLPSRNLKIEKQLNEHFLIQIQ